VLSMGAGSIETLASTLVTRLKEHTHA